VKNRKDHVAVIFMTASASRGLSFPKTRSILVDVPQFAIEQNLMEIIQVVYRGRGTYEEEGREKTLDNQEKEVIFYAGDALTYQAEDKWKSISLQESLLNIINILVILKASLMTRIVGLLLTRLQSASEAREGYAFSDLLKRKDRLRNKSKILLSWIV
jgi:hypothetical protein